MNRGGLARLARFCLIALLAGQSWVQAQNGPLPDASNPYGLFTNLATRLLKSELNVDFNRIQVWPTNQYTPAVHRLIQVSANIVDCTTNRFNDGYPYLPSVFRPIFAIESTNIFVAGYEDVGPFNPTNHPLEMPWRDLDLPADRAALTGADNVWGVPWIVGVKKGHPNFNEVAMQSVIEVTRKLRVVRASLETPQSDWQTNMMYVVGVSNVIGVEFWNSYRTNYPRDVDIGIVDNVTMSLANDMGYSRNVSTNFVFPMSISSNLWVGFNLSNPANTNNVRLLKPNIVFQQDLAFDFQANEFTSNTISAWETSQTFPQPQWIWSATNRLRVVILDRASQRIIDCAQITGPISHFDAGFESQKPLAGKPPQFADLWNTNRFASGAMPAGVRNQILIALGDSTGGGNNEDWSQYGFGNPTGAIKDLEVDRFRAFYGLAPLHYPGLVNTNLIVQVPFSPTARISEYVTWQANDPLVHYMPADLQYLSTSNAVGRLELSDTPVLGNIGFINNRYEPWGGNPVTGPGSSFTVYNLSVKDPLVVSSDNWRFPTNQPLSFDWLGTVHRGTPWQTLFLKSTNVDLTTWQQWAGISNAALAQQTMPTNDWHILGLLASLLNTNHPNQLFSVNNGRDGWLNVLDGITAYSNSVPDTQVFIPAKFKFDSLLMTSNSSQAIVITDAISSTHNGQAFQRFSNLGDLLAVPELTSTSPWLNRNATQLRFGISDEIYEKIPSQLLMRVRADSLGTPIQDGSTLKIRFTGSDGYAYRVESSSNLVDWTSVSTNYPSNGIFEFLDPSPPNRDRLFYRSVLLP